MKYACTIANFVGIKTESFKWYSYGHIDVNLSLVLEKNKKQKKTFDALNITMHAIRQEEILSRPSSVAF